MAIPTTIMVMARTSPGSSARRATTRSEEHTSELQSPCNLVCRLLLEKKKEFVDLAGHSGVLQHPWLHFGQPPYVVQSPAGGLGGLHALYPPAVRRSMRTVPHAETTDL